MSRDQPYRLLLIIFLPILCYLLKFTYYAKHYVQVQELWSEYYAIVFIYKFA